MEEFMKKIILILCLTALVGAGFYWWQSTMPHSNLQTPKTTGLPMKVGKYYWPGSFWIEIAHSKGWFKEAGLNIELVDTRDNFTQSNQDMVDGKMAASLFTLYDLMKFSNKGSNLVAILKEDISYGADVLVSKKQISKIHDLRGKRVGVNRGTFLEYMLATALEKSGLKLKDVLLIETKAEEIEPFLKGRLDAITTWEPHATKAIKQGDGHLLFDSSRFPGLIADVYVYHKKFIDERPDDVQAFVNVWHKTTEYIKANPEEAFGIIANIYNESLADVTAFTQLVQISDLSDNLTAFTYGADFDSLHGAARKINDYMIQAGMTDQQLDSTEFLDPQFIRRLQ
jgi:NitT/TauT family transport system substrate-binding protein